MSYVKGLDKVLKRLQDNTAKKIVEARTTSRSIAYSILNEAIKLCPKDTGYLASTGRVVALEDGYRVEFTAEYAVYVHEDMSIYHETGQAKFLEQAVLNVKRGLVNQ